MQSNILKLKKENDALQKINLTLIRRFEKKILYTTRTSLEKVSRNTFHHKLQLA